MHKSNTLAVLRSVSAAAGMLSIAAPGSAQPPDEIYEFAVLTETLRSPAGCEASPSAPSCTITPGQTGYVLGVLTLTHQAFAHHQAQLKADPALRQARSEKRRAGRGALPEHLPRVEIVVDPEDTACPCCG